MLDQKMYERAIVSKKVLVKKTVKNFFYAVVPYER